MILDKERIIPIAKATLDANSNLPATPGSHQVRIHQVAPLIYLGEGENRVQASSCMLLLSYTVIQEQVPLSFQTYSHADTKAAVTQAAVATVDMGGGRHADFVLSTEADGTIAMSYVPNSTKAEQRG